MLFRHAKAERSEQAKPDHIRALIRRGRDDAARIGAYMANHALIPDRIVTSPAKRTQETWQIAAAALPSAPAPAIVETLYDASPQALFAVIKDSPENVHTLLVVGHNPGLHELALMLTASGDIDARESLGEKLPTSGLVIIDFAFDDWRKLHPLSGRLERFVSPHSLTGTSN